MDFTLELGERKKEMAKNSKSARDFIVSLLDAKSFVETDAFLFTQNDLTDASTLGEGVVTGYGTIADRPVCIYAQNYDVLKGGLGEAHARKILKCMQLAEKTQSALIAVLHTAGARLGEGVTALDGYGEIFAKSVELSGSIPQIAVVSGECFGQMSALAALSDFTFVMKDAAITAGAPQAVAAKANSGLSAKEIGGAAASLKNGMASVAATSSADLKAKLKKLLNLLDGEAVNVSATELNRAAKLTASGRANVEQVLDAGTAFELSAEYAPELATYLGRIGGTAVGVIANCGKEGSALLCPDCCKKAARFIQMLDCFDIPLVSLVDCAGIVTSLTAEQAGFSRDMALLVYAVAEAKVPKIALVTGDAVGFGYTALASKATGFDYTLALDTARISALPKDTGAVIAYGDEIAKAKNAKKAREEVEKKYAALDSNPLFAAEKGSVDNIIPAAAARQYLVSGLQMWLNKESYSVHGNRPY